MVNLDKLKHAIKGEKVLLLGPTGSGKGNRTKDLTALGLVHIGLGAILREQVRSDPDSSLSQKIIETTKKGILLPDEIVVPIVMDRLYKSDCQERGFVLEGFPRTKAQADLMSRETDFDLVLLLDVPRSFLIDGIMRFNRRSCVECLTTYSDFDLPAVEGVCDKCGNTLIRRMSDSVERIRTRIKIYEDEIKTFLPNLMDKGIVQVLPITVPDDEIIEETYLKKLKGEIFRVRTDDGAEARMLNYEGMRRRLYRLLAERLL
ncbi:MAG: nucleoside monophosphate kinase [Nitrospirota bacterium]